MYDKLTEFLALKSKDGNAQNELASTFDFTQATASRKLNGLIDFKSAEIRFFRKKYDLSSDEVTDLFEL